MNRISILTAFLNEESNLPLLRQRVMAVLSKTGMEYDIVLIDDHSTDGSAAFARSWAASDPNVQYIRLARNFGSHAAYSAGLCKCQGDCAVLLAADLQDPPELIPELLEKWQAGNEVVWAARSRREGESLSTRFFARCYYALMRKFALPNMPKTGADFLLMDRKVIDAYNAVPEKNTSFLALILWLGFRQTAIEYVKQSRHSGKSKWSFSKKIKLFIDSMVSFSYAPLRLASLAGTLIGLLGFLYAILVIYNAFGGQPVEGWSSLMVVVLLLGGFQLLMFGVFGEYLWRTFDEARGRPRYVVEEFLPAARNEGSNRVMRAS